MCSYSSVLSDEKVVYNKFSPLGAPKALPADHPRRAHTEAREIPVPVLARRGNGASAGWRVPLGRGLGAQETFLACAASVDWEALPAWEALNPRHAALVLTRD